MPISGLMITCSEDEAEAHRVRRELEESDQVQLGPLDGPRLAAVIDTATQEDNKRLWHWLVSLPGVRHVDVVFVSLEHNLDRPAQGEEQGEEVVVP